MRLVILWLGDASSISQHFLSLLTIAKFITINLRKTGR